MNPGNETIINSLKSRFEYSVYKIDKFRDEVTFYVKRDKFLPLCKSLYRDYLLRVLRPADQTLRR